MIMRPPCHSKRRQQRLWWGCCVLWALPLLAMPVVVQAQFSCTTNNGTITIAKYTGPGGEVTIPDTITGLPVTTIGTRAFLSATNVTSVTMGTSVTNIEKEAFFA